MGEAADPPPLPGGTAVNAYGMAAGADLDDAEQDMRTRTVEPPPATTALIGIGRAVLALTEEVQILADLLRERLRPDPPYIGGLDDLERALKELRARDQGPPCTCGHPRDDHNEAGDLCWGNHPADCGCPAYEATP